MAQFSSPVVAMQNLAITADALPRRDPYSQAHLSIRLQKNPFRLLFSRGLIAFLCVLSISLSSRLPVQAQSGTTTYVYDEDGRLHAVLSPGGEAAVYEYDAAGNFTAIRRLSANDLELLSFTPRQGPVGTIVTIFGTGLNQGVNSVSFNNVKATIVRTTLVSVVAVVPQSATSGPITVVTPRGTISTTTPFVVRGVQLSPQLVTLPALDSVQFDVTVSGTPTSNVTWSVNGIEGGNSTLGTISISGFYTAPNLASGNPIPYAVRATSVDDSELFGEAVVTVVPFGSGYQFRSDGVSVRYGTPSNNSPTFISDALSVRYGTPPNNPPTYINDAVSVRYGTPVNSPPVFVSGAVSASRGPLLTSMSPSTIARGASVTLTIDGIALDGTGSIKFFNLATGNPENGITISNINVNAQGTSLAATMTVASNIAIGSYVVVVTTSAGSTVRAGAASNVLQIN